MLTLFTVPKPFRGHIGIIQRNAILSWLQLQPVCEIILFGDEEGTAELAAETGVRHVPEFVRNDYGTPLLDAIFETAEQTAANRFLVYINADIILMNDIIDAVSRVTLENYLMIGRRWDLDITEPVDYTSPSWETRLREDIRRRGTLHPASGVDYYLYPKGLFGKIPPFAIGRTAYDNWFIYKVRAMGIPVIDATALVTNIHQNHERTYASVGLEGPSGESDLRKGIESERNVALAGGPSHLFSLHDADWVLTRKGLKRALSVRSIYRGIRVFPVLHPRLGSLYHPLKALTGLMGRLRG